MVTDAIPMGVLRGLADLGRRVPQDVRVVGFDNDAEAEFMVPRLTTIDPDNDAMAQSILRLLLGQIRDGHRELAAPDEVSQARLVVRESTGVPVPS